MKSKTNGKAFLIKEKSRHIKNLSRMKDMKAFPGSLTPSRLSALREHGAGQAR